MLRINTERWPAEHVGGQGHAWGGPEVQLHAHPPHPSVAALHVDERRRYLHVEGVVVASGLP